MVSALDGCGAHAGYWRRAGLSIYWTDWRDAQCEYECRCAGMYRVVTMVALVL